MNSAPEKTRTVLFDENRQIARQKRALRINSRGADFLVAHVAEEFAHRISAANRNFTKVADMFSLSGKLSSALSELGNVSGITRYENPQIRDWPGKISGAAIDGFLHLQKHTWPRNLDLVVSAFGFRSINNLPHFMTELLGAMKKDGFLLVALPIGDTLIELRDSLTRAELELTGGAALRVEPFMDLQQAGSLLQTAGFKLPVVDKEELVVRYDSMFALVRDLRAMGATFGLKHNIHQKTHRRLFKRADELYRKNHCDEDGRIRASFCVGYLSGWSPHESQQQPLKPGSAEFSLAAQLKKK